MNSETSLQPDPSRKTTAVMAPQVPASPLDRARREAVGLLQALQLAELDALCGTAEKLFSAQIWSLTAHIDPAPFSLMGQAYTRSFGEALSRVAMLDLARLEVFLKAARDLKTASTAKEEGKTA
jgi:hypothetical protein